MGNDTIKILECVDSDDLNNVNVMYIFGMQCAAGTMQPYPVGKGEFKQGWSIVFIGANSLYETQKLHHQHAISEVDFCTQ